MSKRGPNMHNLKHGMEGTPEYQAYHHMKMRCLNPKNQAYHNYGGRGITVCDRWKESFENFIADMGRKPSKKHSLDRVDNDKGYSPENCRWVTVEYQNRNKRSVKQITFQGRTMCAAEWSRELGIKYHTIQGRLAKGLPLEVVLQKAYRRKMSIPELQTQLLADMDRSALRIKSILTTDEPIEGLTQAYQDFTGYLDSLIALKGLVKKYTPSLQELATTA